MRAIVLMCLLHEALAGFNWPIHGIPDGPVTPGSECKIDQGACGCCMMVQEVNRLTTYFTTSLSKLEMETNQADQLFDSISARRIAFSAALYSGPSLKCDGSLTSVNDMIIVYTHVFINLGDGYNVTTGNFKVPHSGVYSVAVTIYGDAGTANSSLAACAGLQVNSWMVAGSSERNKQDQEDSASISVALHLKAGDIVNVNLPAGCSLCDYNHYNTFSVFLLYPTV